MANWWMIFVAGLLAGATTCAVTQGGLLAGLIARQRKAAGRHDTAGLADDLLPAGGFMVGKLISHVVAGAALGGLGGMFGYQPRLGAAALILAGVVMVVLGLGSLGVPPFSRLTFNPPASWLNVVRGQTRSRSALAPFLLGLAVLLVPCGVTLSMLVLAATSGSPLTGALVMGVFVLGTAPMFVLVGYLARRLTPGGALTAALGVLVVILGLLTINSGLVAAGGGVRGLPSVTAPVAAPASEPVSMVGDVQEVTIDTTNTAYSPEVATAKAGQPIRLTFVTQGVRSCILATTMPTLNKFVMLPETGRQSLDLGTLAAGDYPIACSMGMYTATLRVTP